MRTLHPQFKTPLLFNRMLTLTMPKIMTPYLRHYLYRPYHDFFNDKAFA